MTLSRIVASVEGVARLSQRMKARAEAAQKATKQGVTDATTKVQARVRSDVGSIFGRNRKAQNAIRKAVYDNRRRGAAGLVYSKFGRGRGSSFVDYLGPYLTGAAILPRHARYLAVPLQPGKRNRDPRKVANLRPVRIGGRLFLVRSTRSRTTFYFVLVPRIAITRRLRVDHFRQARAPLVAALMAALQRA